MPIYLSHITEKKTELVFLKMWSKNHPHLNHWHCLLKYICLGPPPSNFWIRIYGGAKGSSLLVDSLNDFNGSISTKSHVILLLGHILLTNVQNNGSKQNIFSNKTYQQSETNSHPLLRPPRGCFFGWQQMKTF